MAVSKSCLACQANVCFRPVFVPRQNTARGEGEVCRWGLVRGTGVIRVDTKKPFVPII